MAHAPKRILVLGGGFAGLWAAAGAIRKLDELHVPREEVLVTLVNRDAYHAIRVRNYEADLSGIRVPLHDVLDPIGVDLVEGEVSAVDVGARRVAVRSSDGVARTLGYDRLVFALGSVLARPAIPGLREHGFDVDTFDGAARLDARLRGLAREVPTRQPLTVVVAGAGLTGLEVATEMPSRLRDLFDAQGRPMATRVILVDRSALVGSDMGEQARAVIEQALDALGIERRLQVEITSVDRASVSLSSGESIAAQVVIWTAGMRAHPLTACIASGRDQLGRIPVDPTMRAVGVPEVFVAGDAAVATLGDGAPSVMSCQHGRPMGRFAGHNVVCDLLGEPLLPLELRWYVTVLDLGEWGALYTEGRDRHVCASGAQAKQTKRTINRERIYPPLSGDRAAILAAAAPSVQAPPKR